MRTRYRDPKSIPQVASMEQWETALALMRTSGRGVLVESEDVVLISAEEFWRLVAIDEKEMREAAARHYRELEEKASTPGYKLSDQEIDDLSVYVGREINEAVYKRWRAEQAQAENDIDE